MTDHDHLIATLDRLKQTALRDQLDSLIDEAGRRELTIRDALALFCEREIARRDQRRSRAAARAARRRQDACIDSDAGSEAEGSSPSWPTGSIHYELNRLGSAA